MIEPQNTTMPLPAAPAEAESPSPDGVGFGEMLAQSVGMTVDPAAIQQIIGEPNGQSFGGNQAEASTNDEEAAGVAEDGIAAVATRYAPVPRSADIPAESKTVVASEAPVADEYGLVQATATPVAHRLNRDPVARPPIPVTPVDANKVIDPGHDIGRPVVDAQTEAVPVAQDVLAQSSRNADQPVEVDQPGVANRPVVADHDANNAASLSPGHADPAEDNVAVDIKPAVAQPVVVARNSGANQKTPTIPAPPDPAVAQPETADPSAASNVVGNAMSFEPAQAVAVQPALRPVRGDGDRRLPTPPDPTAAPATSTSIGVPAQQKNVTIPPAARVDLNPIAPLDVAPPRATVKIGEPLVAEQPNLTPTVPAGDTDSVGVQKTVTTQSVAASTSAAPSLQTALAERVMRAVELQANQPPPRTMVVDIPEIEGLRLVVSVRGGAQVHVVPTTGSATPDSFQPFMDELSTVLADRGFEMTGEGHRQGNDPNEQGAEPLPFRLQRPTFRRPHPTDNDLRI
ncbi:MAG: hypothetical protein QNL12_05565 [Acidimicrobiia bacterium]|nr:hypothetical protein [Acidimicrobiia bacterium]